MVFMDIALGVHRIYSQERNLWFNGSQEIFVWTTLDQARAICFRSKVTFSLKSRFTLEQAVIFRGSSAPSRLQAKRLPTEFVAHAWKMCLANKGRPMCKESLSNGWISLPMIF